MNKTESIKLIMHFQEDNFIHHKQKIHIIYINTEVSDLYFAYKLQQSFCNFTLIMS